jgi:hypothetical protein
MKIEYRSNKKPARKAEKIIKEIRDFDKKTEE